VSLPGAAAKTEDMMKRTALKDRILPDYTAGEERFNCISHIAGGAFGIAVLVLCVARAATGGSAWAVVGGAVYGASMILLYSMSSIYHGLKKGTAKKVLQILDHCTIYYLIGGTYTPILLCSIRAVSKGWAWAIFGVVWGLCIFATVFTAIDLKKYEKLSMACYIGMGWCILAASRIALEAIPAGGIAWLLGGGVAYTVGAVLYGVGKRKRYVHGVFHVFVLLGSLMHFLCIYHYVI